MKQAAGILEDAKNPKMEGIFGIQKENSKKTVRHWKGL